MSALSKHRYLSPEQYILDENANASGIRHEYVNGQAYAMAGASRGHNRIAGKFFCGYQLTWRIVDVKSFSQT